MGANRWIPIANHAANSNEPRLTPSRMPTRAILFDLFGTLVRFNVRLPTLRAEGTEWRSTMPWLVEAFDRALPKADFNLFLEAITAVTAEIVRARSPEYLEVPSRLRFQRALTRMGLPADLAAVNAQSLSLAHMTHLASAVELPAGHIGLLSALAPRFRLALVSNFDHGETARALLDRFGLTPFFEAILISDGFGRRKPHPAIFHAALGKLGVTAAEAVHVGDSLADDIGGAAAAGLRAIWLNPSARDIPAGAPIPDRAIASLTDLRDLFD